VTPLLLLPGMMCDARLWQAQIDALADVAICEVADIGRSDSIEAIADDVLRLAPWPRFALAGLSMGGIVALEVVRRAPGRVTHLALLDTTHRAETPEGRAVPENLLERVVKAAAKGVILKETAPLYLAEANRGRRDLIDLILAMAMDRGPEVLARQARALRERPDSTPTLAGIACPTLVLCGAEDRICPPRPHERMAEAIPAARLVVLDDCGHLPTLERPDAVSAALRDLLAAQPR
jgi:pimeloyl-ACP methyl ester carboxylesterase